MLTPDERKAAGATTRTLQIIVGALIVGVGNYLAVVLLVIPADGANARGGMSVFGVVMAAVAIVAAAFVPRILSMRNRQALVEGRKFSWALTPEPPAGDAGSLLADLQLRRIVAGALLEGAAFANVLFYQIERQSYTLGVTAILILGLVTLIPLRSLVELWLERELRTVRELRELRALRP